MLSVITEYQDGSYKIEIQFHNELLIDTVSSLRASIIETILDDYELLDAEKMRRVRLLINEPWIVE